MNDPVRLKNPSYCAEQVLKHDKDRFLLSLFVHDAAREPLLAIYALNVEFVHIFDVVSEEMIGHVRLAWWQEALDELFAGTAVRPHPVLQALAPLVEAGHISEIVIEPLISSYRASFPEKPLDMDRLLEKAASTLIRSLDVRSLSLWKKANQVIRIHRIRYGQYANGWLKLKLLFVI
ncbi:MAG: squalene/phytoene synthase family protein [Rickettsiales bacterium]|nr:squalene/phytoene synthase family protein [Rickettsiales bacterium]